MDAWKIFNVIGVVLIISAILYFMQYVFSPLSTDVKIILLLVFSIIVFLVAWVLKGRDK